GGAVDQALAELGELAADLGFHVVGEKRAAILVGKRHLGSSFGKTRGTALPFTGDAIAVGGIEIGQPDLALPASLHRSDFDGGDRLEFVLRDFVELLRTGDAAPEHLGIVELRPHYLAA